MCGTYDMHVSIAQHIGISSCGGRVVIGVTERANKESMCYPGKIAVAYVHDRYFISAILGEVTQFHKFVCGMRVVCGAGHGVDQLGTF